MQPTGQEEFLQRRMSKAEPLLLVVRPQNERRRAQVFFQQLARNVPASLPNFRVIAEKITQPLVKTLPFPEAVSVDPHVQSKLLHDQPLVFFLNVVLAVVPLQPFPSHCAVKRGSVDRLPGRLHPLKLRKLSGDQVQQIRPLGQFLQVVNFGNQLQRAFQMLLANRVLQIVPDLLVVKRQHKRRLIMLSAHGLATRTQQQIGLLLQILEVMRPARNHDSAELRTIDSR